MDFTIEKEPENANALLQPKAQEDLELLDENQDVQAIAAFYSQTGSAEDAEDKFQQITFDPKLGLAMENLVSGVTLEQLWRVI